MLALENRKVLKSGIKIPTWRNMKKEAINPKQGGKRKQKQKSVSLKQENNKEIMKQKADSKKKKDKIGKSLVRLIKVEDRSQQNHEYHEMKFHYRSCSHWRENKGMNNFILINLTA